MFRMLQLLEREPQDESNPTFDSSGRGTMTMTSMGTFTDNVHGMTGQMGQPYPHHMGHPHSQQHPHSSSSSLRRENPHKYLLYRPSFSQLFVFLASGFKELPVNGVLLLYLSADGVFANIKHPEDYGYDFGGVITNSRLRENEVRKPTPVTQLKDAHCLYPGDLYPFTRKPFFLIVDSDNSNAFQHIPRYFGQAFLILMSPEEAPPPFHDQQHKGSLFTLFLHCPLTAICLISNIIEVPGQLWDKAQSHVDQFLSEAGSLLVRSRSVDPVFLQFYGDDFLRLLILRFVFSCVIMRSHRLFRVSDLFIRLLFVCL